MKKNKKVNPYEKKAKRKIKISRKQWIALLSILGVVAILAGIIVMSGLGGNSTGGHYEGDGHNHGNSDTGDGHYEGDGHDHGNSNSNSGTHANTNTSTDAKVKYQLYTNADKTKNLVFRDNKGQEIKKIENITIAENRGIIPKTIDADKGVIELAWATGSGTNDFEAVYYNEKTGQVSDKFVAPRGTDGVRIAYGSEDQTKVIVQDLFNKQAYCKEIALAGVYTEGKDIIISSVLKDDKKTVAITYVVDEKGGTAGANIPLYE